MGLTVEQDNFCKRVALAYLESEKEANEGTIKVEAIKKISTIDEMVEELNEFKKINSIRFPEID